MCENCGILQIWFNILDTNNTNYVFSVYAHSLLFFLFILNSFSVFNQSEWNKNKERNRFAAEPR